MRRRVGRSLKVGVPLLMAAALLAVACAPTDAPSELPQSQGNNGTRPAAGVKDTTTTIAGGQDGSVTVPPTTTPAPVPTTVPAAPSSPVPALPGVTYREIDGGTGYFGRWANSYPTDPSFFPIGVWAVSLADDAPSRQNVDTYRDLGINTFVQPYGLTDPVSDYIQANGQFTLAKGSHSVAQMTLDEPDLWGCDPEAGDVASQAPSWVGECDVIGDHTGLPGGGPITPAFLQRWADGVRSRDTSRPIYGQFTRVQNAGTECENFWVDDDTAREYIATSDIISFDFYVLTNPWIPQECKNVWSQGDAVANTRRLADYAKPVWSFIETSYVFDNAPRKPTPAEVTAEVWHSIIGGARGVQYFNHDFKLGISQVLLDSRYRDVASAVKTTNLQVKALAPVLNSPFAEGFASVASGSASVMAKGYDGSLYVFAASRTGSAQDVSLALSGIDSGTATVVNENRTLPISGGRLTDRFANETAVHIYKITPGA